MTANNVLIAAYSGRALAASARRAGYVPLVVDTFADSDTQEIAEAVRRLPAKNFSADHLGEAFGELSLLHGKPIGLVLGAGFESNPGLITHFSVMDTILGCTADTVTCCSDPQALFELLARFGIPHPETRFTPPDDGRGWLSKQAGASGGTHIARCKQNAKAVPGRYFQREVSGTPLSAMAVTSSKGAAFAFTRQWASPAPRRPYRYGGAVGNIEIDLELEARLVDTMLTLCESLSLIGLVSFDFIVTADNEPLLVDVNPRPGATLDVLDDDTGTLFKAHIAAARGEDPVEILKGGWSPRTRAAAYLYADRGRLVVPRITWPDWTADRPAAGFRVPKGAPLATVLAEADTPDAAETLCRERLAALEQMLYQNQKTEDAQP